MEHNLKNNYQCPECLSYLRVWNNIVFAVKSSSRPKQGIILLDPELGNYTITSHPSLKFVPGESVEFFCPVCHKNLSEDSENKNLVKIHMVFENYKKYDIYFSKITGEHSTFKIYKNDIIEKHGEHVSGYLANFLDKWEKQKTEKPINPEI